MFIPKCPICNVELEVDDVYDSEVNSERYIEYVYGHCLSCRKKFDWKEVGIITDWNYEELREV